MSLQLFLGGSGSGKSYQLYQEVINQSLREQATDFLVIVPEQFTLQTQKDIVSMHPNHGVMNVDILSFLRFAYRVFDELGGNEYPILEDTGKSMVMRKVVADKKSELLLFGTNIKKIGFINELKSLMSEFYQYNIGPKDIEELIKASSGKNLLKAKLRDILTVYEGFQSFMKERFITAEEILTALNEIIDRSQWLKNSVICLDGFTGFTPCQYLLLEKMMRYAKKVMVTVTIDPRVDYLKGSGEHQLFGLSVKTINKLYKLAKDTNIPIEPVVCAQQIGGKAVPYRFRNSLALACLEHNLFRYPYECFTEATDDISIHTARDSEAEVAFIVSEIKLLIREKGLRYKDIAVVTGDIEAYGQIVRRLFAKAKLPCFVDYKKKILSNPFSGLIRSAIAIAAQDYSYESVLGYLRCGLSDITQEEADLLENYILATGIRGASRYKAEFTRIIKGSDRTELELLNSIRLRLVNEIQPLYEVLRDKQKNVREYTTALYELGVRLNIEDKLILLKEQFTDAQLPSLAKEYDQIYRTVMNIYDQAVLLLGQEQLTLKEFNEIIETGLVEAKVGIIPPGVDEIVVGDTQRTRLKDIKVLFFIGVNEGIVPGTIGSGGILSDNEREYLLQNNVELAPTKRQQAFTEQFYLYLNLTKPSERLYITYHKTNDEGKSVNPSFLIAKLKALFPQLIINNESEDSKDLAHILRDDGINYLAAGLREYGMADQTVIWKELFSYYRSNERTNETLDLLIRGAFYTNREKGISREAARLLYGEELIGSVTRLERYAGCAFAHFLSYGLTLRERQEYKLAVPDIGNIFHNAIDQFSKRLSEGEYTWHSIPDEVRENWAKESVAYAVEEYENSFIRSTKRNEYLIRRIERITIRTLWALCCQIRQGAFEPSGYEMPFKHVPCEGITLQGRIDRLDLYETEDKVYVRVIDYKSGNTSFDLASIYYGLQQQLALYLSAAMEYMKKRQDNKEIIPAGIFYYHIDDPIVAKQEQPEEVILKSLKMNGLANEDKQVLASMDSNIASADGRLRASYKSDIIQVETNKEGELSKRSAAANKDSIMALSDYVNQKITDDGKQMRDGDTRLNPYRMGKRTACDYCEYKQACGFDLRLPGHGYRNLDKKSIDEIKEEIWGSGDALDQ